MSNYKFKTYIQHLLDKSVPYAWSRWVMAFILMFIYFLRSHFVVTYVISLFVLNLFIGFISPRVDPVLNKGFNSINTDDGLSLPTSTDEFKPFLRRLPEFKFWLKLVISYTIGLFCTFFTFFDLPVFWPVLLFYFLLLTFVTLKAQLEHMIRFRYFPMDFGKKRYLKL